MSAFPKKPTDPDRELWVKFRISAGEVFDAKLTAAQSGTDWLKWVRKVVVKATKRYEEVGR